MTTNLGNWAGGKYGKIGGFLHSLTREDSVVIGTSTTTRVLMPDFLGKCGYE